MFEKYKNHIIAFLLVVVIILATVIWAPILGTPAPSAADQSTSGMALMAGMPMATKTFDVLPGEKIPTVSFTTKQDSTGGWDINITTTNFNFMPEKIDGDPVLGEGHVHLYVDGNLIVVLSPWYHIDALTPGRHSVRVALANNNHSLYVYKGKNIEQVQTLLVK